MVGKRVPAGLWEALKVYEIQKKVAARPRLTSKHPHDLSSPIESAADCTLFF